MKENKDEVLLEVIKSIEKQYGKGSIMKLGDRPRVDIDVISSGSMLINEALGVGGYPKGRIVEIYGPESSGKTTLALHAIAECQKKGGRAAFIDAEHAVDPVYAEALGVDTYELILSQPDSGEQALEIVEQLASTGAIDIIVVDSVAALVPKAEIEGLMGDNNSMGLQARLMSKAMRKLAGILNKSNCLIIFINQLREKISSGPMYGNPETTTGGRALKFYASVRIDIRRKEALKVRENNEEKIVGNLVQVKVVKNKVAPPFKSCEITIIFGRGISKEDEIIDLAVERGLILKSGSWYQYKDEKIGQGKENVKKYLSLHENVQNEIVTALENGEAR